MGKPIIALLLVLTLAVIARAGSFGDCPLSSQHTSCSPKCLQDTECTSMGGKCCPNLCNYRSCVLPKSGSNTNKYKESSTGGAGHCGNVKCGAFEKCGTDPATKRPKCVRA